MYHAYHTSHTSVLTCGEIGAAQLRAVLDPFGLALTWVVDGQPIAGSFWGDREAGLIGNQLLVRRDTPVHSALHEACHYICMDAARRAAVDTDAGGDYDEENGVCYLQVLLAIHIPKCGDRRMFSDMDAWGYTFRLGSAEAWFRRDAEDARQWLASRGIIDQENNVTWRLRGAD